MMCSRVGLFYSKRVSYDAVCYHFDTVKLYPLLDDVFKSRVGLLCSKRVSCDVCYHFDTVKLSLLNRTYVPCAIKMCHLLTAVCQYVSYFVRRTNHVQTIGVTFLVVWQWSNHIM